MSSSLTPIIDGVLSHTIAVAGAGFPLIQAAVASLQLTAAATNAINFKPPFLTGLLYRLTVYVDVTAWTTPASFTLVATFKGSQGASKSITLATFEDDATSSALIDEVSGFAAVPLVFTVDSSGTAITLSTTGTFTGSPVYDLFAVLERLA